MGAMRSQDQHIGAFFWGGVNEATSSFFLIAKSANGNKNYWDSL